jgi:hypothetical protein
VVCVCVRMGCGVCERDGVWCVRERGWSVVCVCEGMECGVSV